MDLNAALLSVKGFARLRRKCASPGGLVPVYGIRC